MALPVHPAEDIVVGSKLKAGEQLTSAAAVESKPSKRKASAVLVIHGMGQQVRFQPLEGVVEGMRRFGGCGDVKAGSLKVDGFDALQRIETSVDSQPVDFYEAYWSPMTEGQVNLKDVVEFLRGGAINGFIRGLSDYFRWIYQRAEKYPIPISTPFQLAAALAVVLALIGINLLSTAVLAGQSFLPVSDDLLKDLSALLGVIAVNAIFLGSILGAARGFRILKPGPFVRHRVEFAGGAGIYQVILGIVLGGWTMGISVLFYAKAKHPEVLALVPRGTVIAIGVIGVLLAVIPRSPARKVGLALFLTGLAIEMADVSLVGYQFVVDRYGRLSNVILDPETLKGFVALWPVYAIVWLVAILAGRRWFTTLVAVVTGSVLIDFAGSRGLNFLLTHGGLGEKGNLPLGVRLIAPWFVVAALSWVVKGFLVQYVGDVAAYVSPQKLDRFFELRKEIQDRVATIARTIFAAHDGESFLYDKIAVMAHSLGSVIAYDTVNRLMYEDDLSGNPLEVVERARLLLTFGSPLNKTAYVFSSAPSTDYVRESLGAQVQPLIRESKFREKIAWINVWSPSDIISGTLTFYDPQKTSPVPKVENRKDIDALTPIAAHVEYWESAAIFQIVRNWIRNPNAPATALVAGTRTEP